MVKLPLGNGSYMLLVLPHEGVNLHNIEAKLHTNIISGWTQRLQEGY